MTALKNLVRADEPHYISEDALNQAIASSHADIQALLQDLGGNHRLNPSESPIIESSASTDSIDGFEGDAI